MKKTAIVFTIVIMLLAVLRFVVIPRFNTDSQIASSCIPLTAERYTRMIQNSELIIIGDAVSEKVKTQSLLNRRVTYTYTTINNVEVLKGSLTESSFEAKHSGGCDPITGMCMATSADSPFELGKRYLLFLSPSYVYEGTNEEVPAESLMLNTDDTTKKEREAGVYGGFSACGGKYVITATAPLEEIKDAINKKDGKKLIQLLHGYYEGGGKNNDLLGSPDIQVSPKPE